MTLEDILRESADRHKHLCPRQVLGARMSLYAGELLGLELPRADKRLLVTSDYVPPTKFISVYMLYAALERFDCSYTALGHKLRFEGGKRNLRPWVLYEVEN